MKTDEEILDNAVYKVTQILRIPLGEIDKTKFVYLYTLLYTQFGGDDELMRHWLNTHNNHLGFCPASRLTDEYSMKQIISYLESFER